MKNSNANSTSGGYYGFETMTPNALLIQRLRTVIGKPGTRSGVRSFDVKLVTEALETIESLQSRLNKIQEAVEL